MGIRRHSLASPHLWDRLSITCAIATFAALGSVFLLYADKGLFVDEVYLLNSAWFAPYYLRHGLVLPSGNFAGVLLHPLFTCIDSLVTIRVLTAAITVFVHMLFATTLFRTFRTLSIADASYVGFATTTRFCLGSMALPLLTYWNGPTPGYNLLNVLGALLCATGFLIALSDRNSLAKAWSVITVGLTACAVSKLPTAICIALLLILVGLLCRARRHRLLTTMGAGVLAATVTYGLLLILVFGSPSEIGRAFSRAADLSALMPSYRFSGMLIKLTWDAYRHLRWLLDPAAAALGMMISLFTLWYEVRRSRAGVFQVIRASTGAGMLAVGAVDLYRACSTLEFAGWLSRLYVAWCVAAVGLILQTSRHPRAHPSRDASLVVLLLYCLPAAIAVGSAANTTGMMSLGAVCWIGATLLYGMSNGLGALLRATLTISSCAVTLWAGVGQVFIGYPLSPLGELRPVHTRNGILHLDARIAARGLDVLSSMYAAGYVAGTPIVDFLGEQGWSSAMSVIAGAPTAGFPSYYGDDRAVEFLLRTGDDKHLRSAWILLRRGDHGKVALLQRCGLPFPCGYDLVSRQTEAHDAAETWRPSRSTKEGCRGLR